jgi:hypothetical protein
MLRTGRVFQAMAVAAAVALAWGYWHSSRHADLLLQVDDYALSTAHSAYGSPHEVSLLFRDRSNRPLAVARSVEPEGYILAVHPDAAVGNCQPPPGAHPTQPTQEQYLACYQRFSQWAATWAPLVYSADVSVGSCRLAEVPVEVLRSNDQWLLWWVPLPHVGGMPRQLFSFSIPINSRLCAAGRGGAPRAFPAAALGAK